MEQQIEKEPNRVKTGWIRFLAAAAAMLLLFGVGFFSVSFLLNDVDFIENEYSELGTDQEMGMTIPDLSRATTVLFDYMRGNREDIKVSVLMNGVQVEDLFYHTKEIVHMEEVRNLWSTLRFLAVVGIAVAFGFLAMIVFFGKQNTRLRSTGLGLLIGTLIFLAIIAAGALWAIGDFNSFWTAFHFIIFPSSLITYLSGGMTVEVYNSLNWVFEPSFAMIRMLDELFLPLVLRAGMIFGIEIFVMLVFSLLLYFRGRKLDQIGSDIVEVRPIEQEERFTAVEDAPDLILQHRLQNASLQQKKKLMEELRKTPDELATEAEERTFGEQSATEADATEIAETNFEELDGNETVLQTDETVSVRSKLSAAEEIENSFEWSRPEEEGSEVENDLDLF